MPVVYHSNAGVTNLFIFSGHDFDFMKNTMKDLYIEESVNFIFSIHEINDFLITNMLDNFCNFFSRMGTLADFTLCQFPCFHRAA